MKEKQSFDESFFVTKAKDYFCAVDFVEGCNIDNLAQYAMKSEIEELHT